MFEKSWPAISPQLFTNNGGTDGRIIIPDTTHFKVKQIVILQNGSLISTYEVKRVINKTTMFVGPIGGKISDRSDISSFIAGSIVYANEQKRSSVPEQEIERLTYEEEPTVARRVTLVDPFGDKVSDTNPLPVAATFDGDVKVGDIRITAADDDPVVGDLHSSVRISNGTDELLVNPDGSINVNASIGVGVSNPLIMNVVAPLANTEYLATLPKETKRFVLRMRNASKCQISYVAGQSVTNYITMSCGVSYAESDLSLTAPLNIYFNSAKSSEIVEIVYWT